MGYLDFFNRGLNIGGKYGAGDNQHPPQVVPDNKKESVPLPPVSAAEAKAALDATMAASRLAGIDTNHDGTLSTAEQTNWATETFQSTSSATSNPNKSAENAVDLIKKSVATAGAQYHRPGSGTPENYKAEDLDLGDLKAQFNKIHSAKTPGQTP